MTAAHHARDQIAPVHPERPRGVSVGALSRGVMRADGAAVSIA